jgi:glycosyltransferase involved in cell wall biosynthesis
MGQRGLAPAGVVDHALPLNTQHHQSRAIPESASARVSVVIPCYNAAGLIARTLGSVFAQRHPASEVIVVNDGSPDTEDFDRVVEPYRDRIVYIKRSNGGPAAARNTGLHAASMPLVAFLDSDDIWHPNFLSLQVGYLQTHPELDMVYADARITGDTHSHGVSLMSLHPSAGEVSFQAMLRRECTVITSSVVARRSVLTAVGGFDESIRIAEDFDLWLRLLRHGGRVGYRREMLVERVIHENNLSSEPIALGRAVLQVLDKHDDGSLTPDERNALEYARAEVIATMTLENAKKRFEQREFSAALPEIKLANQFFRSWKLRLVTLGLVVAPSSLLFLYRVRASRRKAPHIGAR